MKQVAAGHGKSIHELRIGGWFLSPLKVLPDFCRSFGGLVIDIPLGVNRCSYGKDQGEERQLGNASWKVYCQDLTIGKHLSTELQEPVRGLKTQRVHQACFP